MKALEFMPVTLGYGKPHSSFGWPRKETEGTILKRFSEMSGIPIGSDGKVKI